MSTEQDTSDGPGEEDERLDACANFRCDAGGMGHIESHIEDLDSVGLKHSESDGLWTITAETESFTIELAFTDLDEFLDELGIEQ